MSFFVGGAILVSTAASAYSSRKASKENSKGIKKGLDQSAEIARQSRDDAVKLFDMSSKRANIGIQEALNFYKQNAQKRVQPYTQANQQAQNIIGIGARQANNAILGLPVDMNQITSQPQVQADYSGIMGATLPQQQQTFADAEAEALAKEQAAEQAAQQAVAAPKKVSTTDKILSAGDPLGIGKKIISKDPGKKLLKKLF